MHIENMLARFRLPLREGEGAAAGAGAAAAGAGAGAAAAAGAGAAAGAAAAGAGAGAAGASDAPWYSDTKLGIADDVDLVKHLDGKKFPDIKTALTAGMHADNVARSRNVLDKPDPANMKAWKGWQELGWQPELEKYALKRPEVPKGVEYDAGMEDHLRKAAHEARVPLSQAQTLLDEMVKYQGGVAERVAASGARETQALQQALDQKWGSEKDKNVGIAKAAMKASGLNVDDVKILEQVTGAPSLVAFFHRVGSELGEDRLGGGGAAPAGGPRTPEAAQAEWNRLKSDPEFVKDLGDERRPLHAARIAQRDQLMELIAKKPRAA